MFQTPIKGSQTSFSVPVRFDSTLNLLFIRWLRGFARLRELTFGAPEELRRSLNGDLALRVLCEVHSQNPEILSEAEIRTQLKGALEDTKNALRRLKMRTEIMGHDGLLALFDLIEIVRKQEECLLRDLIFAAEDPRRIDFQFLNDQRMSLISDCAIRKSAVELWLLETRGLPHTGTPAVPTKTWAVLRNFPKKPFVAPYIFERPPRDA